MVYIALFFFLLTEMRQTFKLEKERKEKWLETKQAAVNLWVGCQYGIKMTDSVSKTRRNREQL
jgi:hypothetical protein